MCSVPLLGEEGPSHGRPGVDGGAAGLAVDDFGILVVGDGAAASRPRRAGGSTTAGPDVCVCAERVKKRLRTAVPLGVERQRVVCVKRNQLVLDHRVEEVADGEVPAARLACKTVSGLARS